MMSKTTSVRLLIVLLLAGTLVAWFAFDGGAYLNLESLRRNRESLESTFRSQPLQTTLAFAAIYVAVTSLSIPGATILTLAAGAIFGSVLGTVVASLASTIGATLAMLGSRYLFRETLQKKFGAQLAAIDKGLAKDGAFYLLGLRLAPVFPFFLVNLAMGLTRMPALPFALASQIGMLPGTFAYVNAGSQLASVRSLGDVVSPSLLFAFTILAILPIVSNWALRAWKARRQLRRFSRPKRFDYNVAVIGAGSAGLVTAYIAAAVKAKVALIEKHKMGGDCLNTGCVPSKAFIRAAKAAHEARRASEFGVEAGEPRVDFAKVMRGVKRTIAEIAPHDSVERYSSLGVECFAGEARIVSPYEVEVGGKRLTARSLVIATGARPFVPPIPGLSEAKLLTSDTLWDVTEQPRRLIVLGGGPIGCELAQAFQRLGSQVIVIERSERLMGREDADVGEAIEAALRKDGVDVRLAAEAVRVETVRGDAGAVGARVICRKGGQEIAIDCDRILVALGRKANVTGFGLEQLGVEISQRGEIAADEFLRTTNFPNVYVCGDVAGPYQFTHFASHQAWYAAVNALFSPVRSFRADYRVIPWCTFCDPEAARVGLSESEAKERGIAVEVSRYDVSDLDRAITEGSAYGFVKVLTAPGSDKVLGAAIVAPRAGELIAEFVCAMKHGIGLNKILGTIHAYPTFAEANKYAAGVWKRQNAPAWALRILESFHAWRRG